jgi:hypothetical protein
MYLVVVQRGEHALCESRLRGARLKRRQALSGWKAAWRWMGGLHLGSLGLQPPVWRQGDTASKRFPK